MRHIGNMGQRSWGTEGQVRIQGWLLAGALAIAAVPGAAAYGQTSSPVKDDLFAGTEKFAQGASNISEITMDPDSLGLVNGDHARRAHRMVLNVVRTYEYDKPGMYRVEDVEAFRKKLDTGDWHCSVHTRDLKHGDSTDVCNRHRTDGMVETAIITVEPKSLTFIHTIRKPGEDDHGPGPALSFGPGSPDLAQLAILGPALDGLGLDGHLAHLDVMNAEMQARLATLGPEMEARMAALGPAMEAQMAGRMAAGVSRMQHMQPFPKAPGLFQPFTALTPVTPMSPGAPVAPRMPE